MTDSTAAGAAARKGISPLSVLPPQRSLAFSNDDAQDATSTAADKGNVTSSTTLDPLTLLALPEDALMIILNMLDTKSLCSLCMACRQMRATAGADVLWRNLFQARWRWRPSTWALAAVGLYSC